jgi:hypothetical protein
MTQSQNAFPFNRLDSELGLARAIHAKTGRDLFAGVTDAKDRQAAARIAIVMNRLEGEFGDAYARIYGETLPERQRLATTTTKGKSHGQFGTR